MQKTRLNIYFLTAFPCRCRRLRADGSLIFINVGEGENVDTARNFNTVGSRPHDRHLDIKNASRRQESKLSWGRLYVNLFGRFALYAGQSG
ncbi:hypothetical protein [Zobellella sp. DQSA1]|uniref:hypothetical protein n=1 Tax=Zobellella sp. DQSA1 TaxID=3342386 RepID=UPI0035C14135